DTAYRLVACLSGDVVSVGAITVGRMNQLGDHVVVGNDMTPAVGEKSRANGGLGRRAGFDYFDLDDMLGKLLEDIRRGLQGLRLRIFCREQSPQNNDGDQSTSFHRRHEKIF